MSDLLLLLTWSHFTEFLPVVPGLTCRFTNESVASEGQIDSYERPPLFDTENMILIIIKMMKLFTQNQHL